MWLVILTSRPARYIWMKLSPAKAPMTVKSSIKLLVMVYRMSHCRTYPLLMRLVTMYMRLK
jgi:hypothetical protein